MSSSEDEVREALEGKELELSDNVNDYDQGALKSKEKLGDKNLEAKQNL